MRIQTGNVVLDFSKFGDAARLIRSNLLDVLDSGMREDEGVADALESFMLALVAQGVITEENIPLVNAALQTTLDAIDNNS